MADPVVNVTENEITINNINFEIPYTKDIYELKIVTEADDGTVLNVSTVNSKDIKQLTKMNAYNLTDLSYEVPYSEDISTIQIVTETADGTILGINDIVKKNSYEAKGTGEINLHIDGDNVIITGITITEDELYSKYGTIVYKIDELSSVYLSKADIETLVTENTIPNDTKLKYIINTTDKYKCPTILNIGIDYTSDVHSYTTVTNPKNLVHMVNKLNNEVNGYKHVSGNKLITTKASIQNYNITLDGVNDVILRHDEDIYGYRKIEIFSSDGNYYIPFDDIDNLTIIKSSRMNTIIRYKKDNLSSPLENIKVTITIPK